MGKNFWCGNADTEFEHNYPGCIWGMLHALDYHHWHHNVKKMLPHKKHDGRRRPKYNGSPRARLDIQDSDPRARLDIQDSDEAQNLLDAEPSRFFVNERTGSPRKRSLKARVKALIDKEAYKEEDHKQRISGTQARLQRTYSIHYLKPSDIEIGEISPDLRHPIISHHEQAITRDTSSQGPDQPDNPADCDQKFDVHGIQNAVEYRGHDQLAERKILFPGKFDKVREGLGNEKLVEANQLSENASNYKSEDCADVLQLFKVNKELFLKILQNTNDGDAKFLHSLHAPSRGAKLTKSGSFPADDLSRRRSRNFRTSSLKHKQSEIWLFPKGEKLAAGTQAPKLELKSLKHLHKKSGPLVAESSSGGASMLNHETSFSSLALAPEFNKQGSSEGVINIFGEVKQGIKHRIENEKYETNFTASNVLLHDVPKGCCPCPSEKEIADTSLYDLNNSTLPHVKRTSSLNESLDRYTQLFEHSFSRNAKWPLSKSLKLTNECELASSGQASKSFRRIHSLPHLNSHHLLQNEVSHDAHFPGMPFTTAVNTNISIESDRPDELPPEPLSAGTEKHVVLDAKEETECLNNMVERSHSISARTECLASSMGISDKGNNKMHELCNEMDEPTVGVRNSQKEQEITYAEIANHTLSEPIPISVLETCFQEEATIPPHFPISGLESRCTSIKENDGFSTTSQDSPGIDFPFNSCRPVNPEYLEDANRSVENHRHVQICSKDDADFNYVRKILERSGFIGNGFVGAWYLPDQPLNPSVFEELEASSPHEPECSGEDVSASCDRLVLFELVNEVLDQIYDESVSYYPKALSFNCHIRPMPFGDHVFVQVWASVSKSIDLKLDLDQTVDCAVAQDLAKGDCWMNLQFETECVALQLEELIFDEVLEEVISC